MVGVFAAGDVRHGIVEALRGGRMRAIQRRAILSGNDRGSATKQSEGG
jgi:hypothetical protein